MADNAIEKLFEEIRQAKLDLNGTMARMKELDAQRGILREKENEARSRVNLLDETLKKHIHEGMPIVQAKMIAHEEQLEADKQGNLIVGGSITATQIKANTISAGTLQVKGPATLGQWATVTNKPSV